MLIRVGILGLGNMGKLHFLNALRMKGVRVVAVADKNKTNLRIAKEHSVHVYDDYQKLINAEDLNAAVISLPNFLKEESIVYAAEKGLDVFVDKPLARNSAEGTRIVKKVNGQGARLMTGVNYRYIDSVQKLKRMLDEGRIGDVVIATSDLILNGPFSHSLIPKPVPEWWFSKEGAGGGALLDLGYHLIDILNWMFGDLRVEYSGLGYRFKLPIEDSATLVLRSGKSGAKCCVNVGWFSKSIFPDFNFRVTLHGSVGYASTDDFSPRSLRLHAIKEGTINLLRRVVGRKVNYLSYTYYYRSFFKVLELFFESIKKDTEFPISLKEQVGVVRIIEDVYKSNGVALSG
jgi:myo-inositol 2-dehydrogenase/D-chiro-inositol 1-dehydrogenase